MIVGVPNEQLEAEKRVALVPESIAKIRKAGFEVRVEKGAGDAAGYADADYQAKDATIVPSSRELFSGADIVLKVNHPTAEEIDAMKPGSVLACLLYAHLIPDIMRHLSDKKITVLALERIPRISRAQSMDVLSSMGSLAGYKCVIEAAAELPKIFPMMMTAAGTVAPARVFVMGAGVAGLQAIATARRLGAVVEAYDVRPAARDEVLSLGAKFIQIDLETRDSQDAGGYAKAQSEDFLRRQRELLSKTISASDVVITTALVPGKKAPVLVTDEMIRGMRPGSVIVDLAAEQGGNCEGSQPGVTKIIHGVKVVGLMHVASSLAYHASQMFSRNMTTFFLYHAKEGKLVLNSEDEITKGSMVLNAGAPVAS